MYSNIFDTHSHYDDKQFNADRSTLLKAVKQNGVCSIVSCGCDIETTEFNKQLSDEYDFMYFAAGFHLNALRMQIFPTLIKSRNMHSIKNALQLVKSDLIIIG